MCPLYLMSQFPQSSRHLLHGCRFAKNFNSQNDKLMFTITLYQTTAAQHSVHLTGGYVPRFQAVSLAQAGSVKMTLPRPTRQQVTHAVGR